MVRLTALSLEPLSQVFPAARQRSDPNVCHPRPARPLPQSSGRPRCREADLVPPKFHRRACECGVLAPPPAHHIRLQVPLWLRSPAGHQRLQPTVDIAPHPSAIREGTSSHTSIITHLNIATRTPTASSSSNGRAPAGWQLSGEIDDEIPSGAAVLPPERTAPRRDYHLGLTNRRGRTSTDCVARTAAGWAIAGLHRRRPRAEHDRQARELPDGSSELRTSR